jgi:Tfp pilus assembly protein PilN
MINLLPSDIKEQYIYARRNTVLRHWAFALLFGLVGVGIVATGGMLVMQKSIEQFSEQVVSTEDSLKVQKLEETRKHAKEITDSLNLTVKVLSKEVLFSKMLTQIGAVTPPNTSLSDLSISQVQGSIDISAVASDYASASQLQTNLQDPKNEIFSRADIQTITCTSTNSNPKYPCNVTIKALFNENNPFLFINKSKPAGGSTEP